MLYTNTIKDRYYDAINLVIIVIDSLPAAPGHSDGKVGR
jgi:hypothetical protein